MQLQNSKQPLGLFSLIMIAIVSVDSLRNLPISAQYGFSLVTFYLIGGIAFFLPLTWIASKLTALYPETGGSYVWINKALGHQFGNLSIWLQWIYNIIWYPTIFAFINATLAALIAPGLETNKWFILISSLSFFWILTFIHCKGIHAVSWLSSFGAIIGTLLPMLLISCFAGYWLLAGNPSATPFTWQALIPDSHSLHNLGFFSNILFSLLGLEVIAMHAGNVKNPTVNYPRALKISAVLILVTTIISSLALCVAVPSDKIGILTGVMNVFDEYFTTLHLPFSSAYIAACIIIGGLAIASSWMVGLARGLHVALSSVNAPQWLQKSNSRGMPANVLIMQAVIYSLLLTAFIIFPDINSSYWMLSAMTAQFALAYYVLLFFAAAILIRQTSKSQFQKKLGLALPLIGSLICLIGIAVGFIPPDQIPTANIFKYELFMFVSFLIAATIPLLVSHKMKAKD